MAQPLTPTEPQLNVSMRLPSSVVELLEAWAAHLSTKHGRPMYRADVVVDLLQRAKPTASSTIPASVVDAYNKAFS